MKEEATQEQALKMSRRTVDGSRSVRNGLIESMIRSVKKEENRIYTVLRISGLPAELEDAHNYMTIRLVIASIMELVGAVPVTATGLENERHMGSWVARIGVTRATEACPLSGAGEPHLCP